MKKIACVGYHATGSGVIDDLLREFDNISTSVYGAELRILHDPDCISDLEYHLVFDPHRLGTGLAIRRFQEYCNAQSRMEEKLIGNDWMNMVNEYINSLVINKYRGWIDNELQFVSNTKKNIVKIKKGFNYLLRQSPLCNIIPNSYIKPRWYDYYPDNITYYSKLTEEQFLDKTKSFIEKLCSVINHENKEYVVLDQFVSAHNPMRDLKFVDDMKIIIVDRDPRDLYLHNMLHKDHVLPKDPAQFAIQYKLMRQALCKEDTTKVLRIHYEDMIFKYDEMLPIILDFLGIDKSHHISPQKYFKPSVSVNGTQLWLFKSGEFSDAVKIIESKIPEMLYNYPPLDDRKKLLFGIDQKASLKEYALKH